MGGPCIEIESDAIVFSFLFFLGDLVRDCAILGLVGHELRSFGRVGSSVVSTLPMKESTALLFLILFFSSLMSFQGGKGSRY